MNGKEVRFLLEVDVLLTPVSVVRKVISPGEKGAVQIFVKCMFLFF